MGATLGLPPRLKVRWWGVPLHPGLAPLAPPGWAGAGGRSGVSPRLALVSPLHPLFFCCSFFFFSPSLPPHPGHPWDLGVLVGVPQPLPIPRDPPSRCLPRRFRVWGGPGACFGGGPGGCLGGVGMSRPSVSGEQQAPAPPKHYRGWEGGDGKL